MPTEQFPPHVHQHLRYYVYVYRDPRDGQVFYVGKGKGNRAFSHLDDKSERRKTIRIADIRRDGREPQIQILTHGLEDEETAFKVEAAVIDLFGLDLLTNDVRGHDSAEFGIMGIDQVIARYDAKPVEILDKVCLIRVRQLFRYGMSQQELYDATRGIWRLSPVARQPEFAFAVYDQVVQEVYRIAGWFKARSTFYSTRLDLHEDLGDDSDRMEFVGSIAEEKIRRRYRFKNVSEYLGNNSQSPVLYVNC